MRLQDVRCVFELVWWVASRSEGLSRRVSQVKTHNIMVSLTNHTLCIYQEKVSLAFSTYILCGAVDRLQTPDSGLLVVFIPA